MMMATTPSVKASMRLFGMPRPGFSVSGIDSPFCS
jgi:hypothetical protein